MTERGEADEAIRGEFVVTMGKLFATLGRALICLNKDFEIVHASEDLDALAGAGASARIVGLTAEKCLGSDLFGPTAGLRRALEGGERREGWGASMTSAAGTPVLLSISAAPVGQIDSPLCDPRVAYLLIVRSAEDPTQADTALPMLFSGMVARSSAMLRIFRLVRNLEESDATILLAGESGVGKELVARAIHLNSPRSEGRFVAVNCGALPADLLESELFGHVRGAFTGAVRDREGRFALAADGTLFLDEIGDLPLQLQVKLLRVLQERTFERVGESRSRTSNARIIAATNRDLRREVLEGRFRDDLYYRLRVVPITVPPLRERREDIEPLARHLLVRVSNRHGRSLILSPNSLRLMLVYAWPGNAREMENALEYAVAVCRGQTIHPQDLPAEIVGSATAAGRMPPSGDEPGEQRGSREVENGSEVERFRAALDTHAWSREATAHALGMSRTTLWRRMRELGLTRRRADG